LKKSLGRTSLGFEAMRTLLVEIETTINNRPITYIYDDEDGVSYPLTPSQLIYGRQIELAPNARQFAIISTNQSLTKRAKYQMSLLKHFTNCWRKEYLLSLRETGRAIHSKSEDSIKVGDIVVLKNDSSPRVFWKLARVMELIRSKDNEIRAAKIRVVNSEGKKVTDLRRPVQHLVPLEVRTGPDSTNTDPPDADQTSPPISPSENEDSTQKRSRRTAAVIGELLRRDTS
jgi:hypothetical protein